MKSKLNLKDWSVEDRPREKFAMLGAESLSKSELLAILLGSGNRTKTAVELAQEILSFYDNSLTKISKLQVEDLCQFNGMGPAKAVSVLAGLELARRKLQEKVPELVKISSSKDVFDFARAKFLDKEIELFEVILLNRANQVLDMVSISAGGRSGTVVDGKVLFQKAIIKNASSLILCHNHPSGNTIPSEADKVLTKRMSDFGKMIDLPVLDHLIFGGNNYYSFADEGLM